MAVAGFAGISFLFLFIIPHNFCNVFASNTSSLTFCLSTTVTASSIISSVTFLHPFSLMFILALSKIRSTQSGREKSNRRYVSAFRFSCSFVRSLSFDNNSGVFTFGDGWQKDPSTSFSILMAKSVSTARRMSSAWLLFCLREQRWMNLGVRTKDRFSSSSSLTYSFWTVLLQV